MWVTVGGYSPPWQGHPENRLELAGHLCHKQRDGCLLFSSLFFIQPGS